MFFYLCFIHLWFMVSLTIYLYYFRIKKDDWQLSVLTKKLGYMKISIIIKFYSGNCPSLHCTDINI